MLRIFGSAIARFTDHLGAVLEVALPPAAWEPGVGWVFPPASADLRGLADGTVSVRKHREGDLGAQSVSDFAASLSAAILARE